MTSDTGFNLETLRNLLNNGSLTCDLSDLDDNVAVLPMTFCWRSNPNPFLGPAHTVNAPRGDLDAVYRGIRTVTPGCVLVIQTGGSDRAIWGETATGEALRQGVAGVILDGACRDVPAVRASGLPVVARGVSPKRAARTGRGQVGTRLEFYGVTLYPGDLIVSDENGTAIVPQASIGALSSKISRTPQEDKNGFNG